MWKKFKALFSLEARLASSLQKQLEMGSGAIYLKLEEYQKRLEFFEKQMLANMGQVDTIRAEFNKRLSRIEVLFSEELAAKEKARDARIASPTEISHRRGSSEHS